MSCKTNVTDWPEFSESLDPDEPVGKEYTIPISVLPGDSVTAADLLEVDKTSKIAANPPKIVISGQTIGNIEPLLDGTTFRAQGKGLYGSTFVRCHYVTALGNGDYATFELKLKSR